MKWQEAGSLAPCRSSPVERTPDTITASMAQPGDICCSGLEIGHVPTGLSGCWKEWSGPEHTVYTGRGSAAKRGKAGLKIKIYPDWDADLSALWNNVEVNAFLSNYLLHFKSFFFPFLSGMSKVRFDFYCSKRVLFFFFFLLSLLAQWNAHLRG